MITYVILKSKRNSEKNKKLRGAKSERAKNVNESYGLMYSKEKSPQKTRPAGLMPAAPPKDKKSLREVYAPQGCKLQ